MEQGQVIKEINLSYLNSQKVQIFFYLKILVKQILFCGLIASLA
jgi:hypothetical protein